MLDDVEVCRRHWVPFYTAAGALIAARQPRRDASHAAPRFAKPIKVGAMAKWTVSDPDNVGGPKAVRYRPRSEDPFPRGRLHQTGRPILPAPVGG
jgi:hypothetical protein